MRVRLRFVWTSASGAVRCTRRLIARRQEGWRSVGMNYFRSFLIGIATFVAEVILFFAIREASSYVLSAKSTATDTYFIAAHFHPVRAALIAAFAAAAYWIARRFRPT